MGYQSLQLNTTGQNNTAIGTNSLLSNTTGQNNTAIGTNSLLLNITGNTNVAIGTTALYNNIDGDSNIAINDGALLGNTSGIYNIAIGQNALLANTTGSNNTAIGNSAGVNLSGNSNYNTFLGNFTDVSLNSTIYSNSTAVGYGAIIDASNQIVLGNSSIVSLNCQVQTITSLSDARDKKDIQPLTNGISFVEKLNPVSFIWNMRDKGKVDIPEIGFIAQELVEIQKTTGITIPNLVSETNPDRLEASYGTLLPILVKSVQELSAKVTSLETELNELKSTLKN